MDQTSSREARRSGRALLVTVILSLLVVGLAGSGGVYLRNQMVALDTEVQTQWKQVENELARQSELLPKLAAVTRRYASHEEKVIDDVVAARKEMMSAALRDRVARAGRMDALLLQTLALAENYPQLRSDAQFRDLSFEIAGTKNRIAIERQRYNELVGLFNARLQQLPWSLVAEGMKPYPYYEPEAAKLAEPELGL